MGTKSQRPNQREGVISALNAAIEALNLAKEAASITPVNAIFGSVVVILTTVRDTMVNRRDYVELGLSCTDVCTALDRGLRGKRLNDLNSSVCEAIEQLTTAVAAIQERVINQGKRNVISRHFNARYDKERISAWRSDLNIVLHVFNTELAINTHVTVSELRDNVTSTHTMVSDIHRTIVKGQEGSDGKNLLTQASIPGETPPLPSRTFFGRDELIDGIVDLAENLVPLALIGAGGIGKTSVALAVLHHDRIKQRFGDDRRFIRCDQFPASRAHFLRLLSNVIGAGIENPEDLAPLRAFLSSKEMLIVLDNAESILDPLGTDAQEIYSVVEELGRFNNICVCITSRISTTPPDYKHLDIPALSIDAARDTFYRIYDSDYNQPNPVDGILEQLDFHPLSITLLATVAHQNKWNTDRLAREWEKRRTDVLRTQHNKSLAAAIELSLASTMFRELGSEARALLGVVAFFPQGVDENNVDWLFPTIPNRTDIFDKFCILSLTYRSHGSIMMLAPLRDYLSPKDPRSSSLLCATKERYFIRISVNINPNKPNFGETRWITSEDINVEHLLDVFTTIDANSDSVWRACANFMTHLFWHKKRLVILKPKIEGLPDDHHYKPECLFELSRFDSVGDRAERKRLLTHALKLWRERERDNWVARTLRELSDSNRRMGLHDEGIQLITEALEIYERLGDSKEQARSLKCLARLLHDDNQLDAAEEAASRAIDILPETGEQFLVCQSHRVLGKIHRSKGRTEKAVHHLGVALAIASPFDWHSQLSQIHRTMGALFLDDGRFDDAQAHIEQAKLHAVNSVYNLGRAMELQAKVWYKRQRVEEARSEALRAADVFEKLGAANDLEWCSGLLRYMGAG